MTVKKFSPLNFLSSLGAGGLAVAFFAFINYTLDHGKGLVTFAQTHELSQGWQLFLYSTFEAGMIIFIVIHFILTIFLLKDLFAWLKSDEHKTFMQNPLSNSGIMGPLISLTMTINVFVGPLRYFVPALSNNFQSLMLPGLLAWSVMWLLVVYTAVKLLRIAFDKGFDVDKVNFGWLLQPMTLGMVTVTGAGLAALAQSKQIADIAAFLSFVSGSMGLFLLLVKTVAVFKSHFRNNGLPEKEFLPSLLIVVPNITIYAISIFRFGHYLEHHYGSHLGAFFMIVMTVAFAFETWYLFFGLALLNDYFKKHVRNEFHVSQWGLICPFVAYAVLGAFVYNLFLPYVWFMAIIVLTVIFTVALFMFLLFKQFRCKRFRNSNNVYAMQACE